MSGLFLSIFQYKVHLGLLVSAYESITIDELKEQTNNSLDRVTEEQHPLRVFMNDGKVLLLFPQDLLAPICDSNFRLILLSAMRYAMDRNTYMPIISSVTVSFWMISFSFWLPMIFVDSLKNITQNMGRPHCAATLILILR